MDYEKKYNSALNLAKSYYGKDSNEFFDTIFPELRESEDERIRKEIIELLKEVGRDDTGISENAKCMIAWLEKQKEPENTSATTMAPSCWAEKQKEQKPAEYIKRNSKEWYALLSEQYDKGFWKGKAEQKLAECIPDSVKFEEGFKTGRELGFREGVESVKLAEWSEEDEKRIQRIYDFLWKNRKGDTDTIYQIEKDADWLKSLRPDSYKNCNSRWKPSKEQPEVGLEKEIEVASKRFPEVSFAKLSRIAKRFYELGLRAGQVYAATTYNPPCYCGGPCTNPMHDCINCPRQLTGRINTTTGTSSAKLEESK